jgi:hypothetical protein
MHAHHVQCTRETCSSSVARICACLSACYERHSHPEFAGMLSQVPLQLQNTKYAKLLLFHQELSVCPMCAGGCKHRLQQSASYTIEAAAEGQGSDVSGVRGERRLCEEGERPVCAVDSVSASDIEILRSQIPSLA